jgi:hemolysin III
MLAINQKRADNGRMNKNCTNLMPPDNTKIRISEYGFKEELLNILTHGAGALLSIVGFVALCQQANSKGTSLHLLSYIIFGSTLTGLYLASTLYHSFSNTKFNQFFKRIDHLSIYFLIAGTYSPLMLVGIEDSVGLIMITVIWGLVIVSCIFRCSKNKILQRIAFINYLLMGWLVLIVLDKLFVSLSTRSMYLLIAGGLFYTVGVIFYLWEKLPFNHSIWHLFVLGGSTSHYFSIYSLLAIEV